MDQTSLTNSGFNRIWIHITDVLHSNLHEVMFFQAKVAAKEEIDLPPSYSDYEEEESEEENQPKDSPE
jgi:hypothetical protein